MMISGPFLPLNTAYFGPTVPKIKKIYAGGEIRTPAYQRVHRLTVFKRLSNSSRSRFPGLRLTRLDYPGIFVRPNPLRIMASLKCLYSLREYGIKITMQNKIKGFGIKLGPELDFNVYAVRNFHTHYLPHRTLVCRNVYEPLVHPHFPPVPGCGSIARGGLSHRYP